MSFAFLIHGKSRVAFLAPSLLCFVLLSFAMWRCLLWGLYAIASRCTESRLVIPNAGGTQLNFSPDGSFRITTFQDLHYGEAEDNPPESGWGPISDLMTTVVMNTILEIEEADLVVLNGDLITGENTYLHNSTSYLDMIVQPMVKRQIPWACTYGNHDHQYNISGDSLLHRERSNYPFLGLTRSMVSGIEAGTTNYYLIIKNPSTGAAKMILWFFDSKGGREFQQTGSDGQPKIQKGYVDSSVVSWFETTRDQLVQKHGKVLPSIAFVHIPTYATAAFQNKGIDKNNEPGINEDNPLASQTKGGDTPFMKALLETQGLTAVFSGHDHGDDWCHKWDSRLPGMHLSGNGIVMCFGRHTGYGGYGRWTRGARQIMLYEDMRYPIETWIRLEDERMTGSVILNSTFGKDKYPVVNVTYSS